MSGWRPLSKRGQSDPRLDEPTEGLPPYLAGPLIDWLQRMCTTSSGGYIREEALKALQLQFKLDPPLNWKYGGDSARTSLLTRVAQDEEFGLDAIDYVLSHISLFVGKYENPADRANEANLLLRIGGSAWEVTGSGNGRFQLSRRAVGPVREAIESIPSSTRAHQHLVAAWNHLSGRNPDESAGYREAVRAVEAAAKPVVLPANDRATLGQMIAALGDKPEKWAVTIGTVDDVRRLMEVVWTSQLDRHGTDDETVPLNVSPDQADAAFALCLNLVRLFAGGHIRPTG